MMSQKQTCGMQVGVPIYIGSELSVTPYNSQPACHFALLNLLVMG